MNWWGWLEFFKGDEGFKSMTRLIYFLTFFPSSYVVIDDGSAETLGWYLSAYVVGYVGGKASDAYGKPKKPTVNAENVKNMNVNQRPATRKRGKS